MKFDDFELKMGEIGFSSLAEIARFLETTPQAVSNWKSRDQVPHHVEVKIRNILKSSNLQDNIVHPQQINRQINTLPLINEGSFSLSDILLVLAKQIKIVALSFFVITFISFTYVQFIMSPTYISWASLILPNQSVGGMGGLSGLASQFGVNIPSEVKADLSSPTFIPELLKSRTFAEKILNKKFYSSKYNKDLSLLAIISDTESESLNNDELAIAKAISSLDKIIDFKKDPSSAFSIITVTTNDPQLSKDLARVVIVEMEKLNRFYKSQSTSEKTRFINQRIKSVVKDLEVSERALKVFNEQNRQVTSPSLQLEQDRLDREVEVQKEIFLTLKQQLELSKIEEVQGSSILQILDNPQLPIGPSNKNIIITLLISGISGLMLGIFLAFSRTYFNNSNIDERRKLRKVRNFFRKKIKDLMLDGRFTGTVSILMLITLPVYLRHESTYPVFFNRYSVKLIIILCIYILILSLSSFLFLKTIMKKKSENQPYSTDV